MSATEDQTATLHMSTFPASFDKLNFIRNQYSSVVLLRTRMLTIVRMVAAKKYNH